MAFVCFSLSFFFFLQRNGKDLTTLGLAQSAERLEATSRAAHAQILMIISDDHLEKLAQPFKFVEWLNISNSS